jgi:hypothetical protein
LKKLRHNDPSGPKLNIQLNDILFSPRRIAGNNPNHLLSQLLQSSRERGLKAPISVRLEKLEMPSTSRITRKRKSYIPRNEDDNRHF